MIFGFVTDPPLETFEFYFGGANSLHKYKNNLKLFLGNSTLQTSKRWKDTRSNNFWEICHFYILKYRKVGNLQLLKL